MATEKITK